MDCGGITIGSGFQSSTSTDVTRAGSFLVDVDQPDTGPSYKWTHSRSKGSSSSRSFTLAKVLLESLEAWSKPAWQLPRPGGEC